MIVSIKNNNYNLPRRDTYNKYGYVWIGANTMEWYSFESSSCLLDGMISATTSHLYSCDGEMNDIQYRKKFYG